jgi:uncharacterized membrane protein
VIALAACYALLAHLAVETGSARLTAACLALLAAVVLARGMAHGSRIAWALAIVAGAGLALAASRKWVWLPLYLPSVSSDAIMAWVFGHTLAADRVPLIERMARRLRGAAEEPVEPEVARYARSLTLAWTVLFAVLGLISLVLALCAEPNGVLWLLGLAPPVEVPQSDWSWFANIGEYGIVAGFFMVEYAYRRRRFPEQPYEGFADFVRRLAAMAPTLIERGPRRAGSGSRRAARGTREMAPVADGAQGSHDTSRGREVSMKSVSE